MIASSQILWQDLYYLFTPDELAAAKITNCRQFAASLLPPVLLSALFRGEQVEDISRTTIGRVFKADQLSKKRFMAFRKHFLETNPLSGESYSFDTHPLRLHIEKAWEALLADIEEHIPGTIENVRQKTQLLLEGPLSPVAPSDAKDRLSVLFERSLNSALAALTVMASSLPFWEDPKENALPELFEMILGAPQPEFAEKDRQLLDERLAQNNKIGEKCYAEAMSLFTSQERNAADLDRIYNLCLQIINMQPHIDDRISGEAEYLCYRLGITGEYPSLTSEQAKAYLKQSNDHGNPQASIEWAKMLTFAFRRSEQRADADAPGCCWTNCWNAEAAAAFRTKPDNWLSVRGKLRDFMASNKGIQKRLFFFSGETTLNLENLLEFLEILGRSDDDPNLFTAVIRGSSDFLSPMMDTALAPFEKNCPHIFILDEVRSAAWELLGKHPLFYPVRHVQDGEYAHLRVVILGGTPEASFLVRESFHLLDFDNFTCEIDLLAPNAEAVQADINVRCPGMIRGRYPIAPIFTPDIQACSVDFKTFQFYDWLSSNVSPSDSCYFIVAAGSDKENIDLALRLREWSVRFLLKNGRPMNNDSLPPIAFLCRNPDVSHLSSQLFVNNLEFGNRWYNNQALIPFGSRADLYHWDKTVGGLIDRQARVRHLVYSSTHPNASDPEQARSIQSRYDRWQYPRESTMAGVLALPYTLFAARSGRADESDLRLLPEHWNILDRSAWTDRETKIRLAIRFEQFLRFNREEVLENLATHEHARWCRFMFSRGWIPASFKDVVRYRKGGVPSHQLYIAKMHPCICSDEDLQILQRKLLEKFQLPRDFRKADLCISASIPDLLRVGT